MPDDLRELDRELAALLEPELPAFDNEFSSDPAACHELKLEMVRRGWWWETGVDPTVTGDLRVYARIIDGTANLVDFAAGDTEMHAFAKAALAALKGAAK